jgi:hypothetical protein
MTAILASIFGRLTWHDWQLWLPGIGFVIFFSVFLYVTIRITRMPRPRRKHLAELPLEDDEKPKPEHEQDRS